MKIFLSLLLIKIFTLDIVSSVFPDLETIKFKHLFFLVKRLIFG